MCTGTSPCFLVLFVVGLAVGGHAAFRCSLRATLPVWVKLMIRMFKVGAGGTSGTDPDVVYVVNTVVL